MDITANFHYGHVLISSAILAGFIGFSVFNFKITPVLHSMKSKKISFVYYAYASIITSQLLVIITVILDHYYVLFHLAMLAVLIIMTAIFIIVMKDLRKLEAEIDIWKDIGSYP